MRTQSSWLDREDEAILDHLAAEGPDLVSNLASALQLPVPEVRRRCQTLRSHGLLESFWQDGYRLTETGRAYLAGDLDAGELRDEES